MFPKPIRKKSKSNLANCRKQPCIICLELRVTQRGPTQPDHLTSRGAGGGDDESNLLPCCFLHHRERHDIGLPRLIKKYKSVRMYLELKGRDDLLAKSDSIE